MADATNTTPLAGIKVIDWTQVQSGPSCTQMLAWMGAEVIKLEKVKGGDPTRNEMNDVDGSYSLYFLQLNANKKSITLDMKDPEGKKILTDLLKDAADALEDATEALDRLGSYNNLEDKPQINGVTLSGNKTSGELRVVGWKNAEIDNCIENGVVYFTSINAQVAYVLAMNVATDIITHITQYAFCRDGRVMWRTRQAETQWQPAGEWSEWEEIGLKIASGVVNQNGTITFFDENGDPLFTTTGESVIGPSHASPEACE